MLLPRGVAGPVATLGVNQQPPAVTALAAEPAAVTGEVAASVAYRTYLSQVTKILQAPGDPSRWFVLQKTGRVQVFDLADPSNSRTWLDFSTKVNTDIEGGLLGMAFHPNFPGTPEVYVSYTGDPGQPMISRISRVILDDTDSPQNVVEQLLITINQPFTWHNGGDIAFGTDGYLYIGLGDGGGDSGEDNRAQDTTDLLGSMLRIAVLDVAWPNPGYRIPAKNPFASNPKCGPGANAQACPEIFAWGFRNPWRWSFDEPMGTLWAGDVGENSWEEVDIVQRGGNYGWRCREGAHDFKSSGCPTGGLIDPVAEYDRSEGYSVTGGYVYRGTAMPGLLGRYVFGDFVTGTVWALAGNGQGGYSRELLVDTPYSPTTFGLGDDGEIYIGDYAGDILKLVPGAGGGCHAVTGTAGADTLQGTTGTDCIDGKAGADTMYGLGGDDSYVVDNTGDTVIEGVGEGNDTIKSSATYALPGYVETLLLTGTTAINGNGNGLNNSIAGNAATNALNGKAGADTLSGKGGNDTYYVDNAGDKVVEGVSQGTDTVRSTVSHTLRRNVENLVLTGTANTNGTGNTLDNRITGNAGNNTLNGGTGNDTLVGRAGLDRFLFKTVLNPKSNVDRITDFLPVDDRIRLENAIFAALTTTGTLPASALRIGGSATTAAHRIIYNPTNGALLYDADGTGATPAVRFATLPTGLTLTNADFYVQ
jgi:Ca2+-binding RTX toxin-like protein